MSVFDWLRFLRPSSVAIESVSASECGLVRKENEDHVFVDAGHAVFCVADGMGGGSEGGTASAFMCEEMRRAASVHGFLHRREAVEKAVSAANVRIRDYAAKKGFRQMGTTLAVLMFDPDNPLHAAACHVGDSRIYCVRRGRAVALTRDHTVGSQLGSVATGPLADELRSRLHPLSHVLTRSIGTEERVSGEWTEVGVEQGDVFVVCSDGVHDIISDSLLGEIVSSFEDLNAVSVRLRGEILRLGAPDNYSFLLVRPGGRL